MKMMRRMILFDLDGTLLTSDGTVCTTTANTIKYCKQEGYYIGYVTARSRSKKNIRLLDGLPCDFTAFYNGAVICTGNQLIESNVLSYKQAVSILQRLNKDFPDVTIDVHQEPWHFSSICSEMCYMDPEKGKVCSPTQLPKRDVQRIRLKSENLMSVPLQKYMTPESTFYHSTFGDVIIGHKNANKGNAAKRASKFFGTPLAQMIAFGDDINDIDMLKIVGTGVAMGNAVLSLKKIADYVTKTNDENGITFWINEYLVKYVQR